MRVLIVFYDCITYTNYNQYGRVKIGLKHESCNEYSYTVDYYFDSGTFIKYKLSKTKKSYFTNNYVKL